MIWEDFERESLKDYIYLHEDEQLVELEAVIMAEMPQIIDYELY